MARRNGKTCTGFAAEVVLFVSYVVLNAALNTLNRILFDVHGFELPLTLTAVHILCNTVLLTPMILFIVCSRDLKKVFTQNWSAFFLVGLLHTVQIALDNQALISMQLPINQAIQATLPVFLALLHSKQPSAPSMNQACALVVVSTGFYLVVNGVSVGGAWPAIPYAIASVALQAWHVNVASRLLSASVSLIEIIIFISPFALATAAAPAIVMEDSLMLNFIRHQPVLTLQMALSTSSLAVICGAVKYKSMSQLGASGYGMLESVKVICLMGFASLYIDALSDWTSSQYFGVTLTCVGSVLYQVFGSTPRSSDSKSGQSGRLPSLTKLSPVLIALILSGLARFVILDQLNVFQPAVRSFQNLVMPLAAKQGVDPCRDLTVDASLGRPKPPEVEGELVLVTGGSGFIGSHLVEQLLDLGYTVRVFDNLETGQLLFLNLWQPRLQFHFGDIMDTESLDRAMVGVRGVFHLGAASKVLPSLKSPAMGTFNVERNAVGTSRVLQAANETKTVRKVLYAASSTYYGNQAVPFSENDPFVPTSPYAASKYMGELGMLTHDVVYNLHTLSLRFFMVYGPRNPFHGAYAVVTGKFLARRREGLPLIIEGSGENFRDFVHVKDVSRALILGYQSDVHATAINIGTGTAHSVKEVADLVSNKQQHIEPRKNDLKGTLADTCRAKRLLNFEAEYDFVKAMHAMIRADEAGDTENISPRWRDPVVEQAMDTRIPGWSGLGVLDRGHQIKLALDSDPAFLDKLLREV